VFIAQKRLAAAVASVGADDADDAEADGATADEVAEVVDDGITDESASAVFDF
jgi:hypothetical protein